MRWIKDSIHGDIMLTPLANALIDTPEMQRLRRIGQTAFCNLLYPGANHTRFEHSIGTYHLTRRAAEMHGIKNPKLLETAAMLHDVGHSCFSHTLEELVVEATGKDHEGHTRDKILNGTLAQAIEKKELQPKKVVKLMDSPEYELVHGYLGTDKIDYLLRDSKYTGVAYGSVDSDRLLRKILFKNGQAILEESGLSVAESVLLARFMMFTSVYTHHIPYSAEEILVRATEEAIRKEIIQAEDLLEYSDGELTSILRIQEGVIGKNMERILHRKLPKEALVVPLKSFSNWHELTNLSRTRKAKLEESIALSAKVPANDVILYTPNSWFKKIKTKVKRGKKLIELNEISLLSRVLSDAQWDYSYVSVLCPKKQMSKVRKHAPKILESV